jgi:leader peptidase (prepilin peptidase) / N-methyltransferase
MIIFPFSPLSTSVIVFLFGAIVGSFLNVCIVRVPKDESVIHPPSHCPKCKTPLSFYDNIPLFSYLFLRGRCHACRGTISPRYFVMELLMPSLSVILFYEFGLSLAFFVGFIFVTALSVISFIAESELAF